MRSEPLVSVVIIFLNGARFLPEAIASIMAQTYSHWEILLVDDGSTDGSTDIAVRYADSHPRRIRYLEHEGHRNLGMSASRNLGIHHARGELLSFLDCDDVWLPIKLERQWKQLAAHPAAAMVCGPTRWWYSWTDQDDDRQRDAVRTLGDVADGVHAPPTLLDRFLLREIRTPATCSVLLRQGVFEHAGYFEETFRGLYEDQAFFAKVYATVPVLVTSECLDLYRQHPESCCAMEDRTGTTHDSASNLARIAFLAWLTDFAQGCASNARAGQAVAIVPTPVPPGDS